MKNKFRNIIYIPLLFFAFLLFSVTGVFAQGNDTSQAPQNFEGKVIKVLEERETEHGGYYQKLEIEVLTGDSRGDRFIVESGFGESPSSQQYRKGDGVVLTGYQTEDGETHLFIDDFVRRDSLLLLFIIFLVVAVAVAGKRGITSFIGMVITFIIIFWLVLPKISTGSNPLLIVVLFSLIAIPVTFYLSHGVNKKTNAAIAGTCIALFITALLSTLFVGMAKLTGYTTDEASFLQIAKGGVFDMRGILLAGIIIGMLGVLDDITVSQSSIVFQLKDANKRMLPSDLFKRAMDVGKDHIASMINTLILVYTGAALPLLLLFIDSSRTFSEVINYEIIASEVIRTLLGSIGLVLAVPITTLIAVGIADGQEDKAGKQSY